MNKVKEEYPDIEFVFVYTKEAHPDDAPVQRGPGMEYGGWRMPQNKHQIDTHKNYDERLAAAKLIGEAGKEGCSIIVDDMASTIQQTWGKLPNSAILVGPDGRIVHKWPWVQMMFQRIPKQYRQQGQKANKLLRQILEAQNDFRGYSVADDEFLPLRDTVDGEWLSYTTPEGQETYTFDQASAESVRYGNGEESKTVELEEFVLEDEAKTPKYGEYEVKGITLPCIVTSEDGIETWYSMRLPGIAIVKVVVDGVVTRELSDAGFVEGESCLTPFVADPRPESERSSEEETTPKKAPRKKNKQPRREEEFSHETNTLGEAVFN